jgi:hypothetical protein
MRLEQIENHGITAKGRQELIKHLKGQRLTFRQSILAKCYDCMGYYADGKMDCIVKDCPLYPFMPYKDAVDPEK